jgi:uncharacterized protein
MREATLRFYAQLNDFLPYSRRQVSFQHFFKGEPSIKDMIESLGVPHTEVSVVLVNSEPVNFQYHVQPGDRVSIYPTFTEIDMSSLTPIRAPLPETVRFVADVHLGRLAAYLRMLGFDTAYPENYRDEALAAISSAEDRILLTRDRGLLKRKIVTHGYCVRESDPMKQLEEVLKRFNLIESITRFHRCTHCNGVLRVVDKESLDDETFLQAKQYYDEFRQCEGCGKVYWRGSHYNRMDEFIDKLLVSRDADAGGRR